MQSKRNLVFLELLKLPSVELLQVKNKETLALYKGVLQVIRNDTLDLVLLKLDEIKLPLNNSLPVIGALSGEEKFPAYLMPTFDGFYMIRILDSNPGVVLTNFETILESTCEFHRRTGMEKKLGEIKEPTIESKLGVAKDIIHKTKEAISKNIMPVHERHPNYILIRTYNELINVDSPSVPVVDVPTQEVENVTAEVEEIVRNHLSNKYWAHFSELQGIPIKQPVLKTLRSTLPVQQFEQQRPRAQSFGAENIATIKKDIDFDSQEIVGTENQRLPAYEVQATKEHVVQGLASCEAKYHQNLEESKKKQEVDDDSLMCDLMRSKECKRRADEPAPILGSNVGKENLEIIQH